MNNKNIIFIYKQPKKLKFIFLIYSLLIIVILIILCRVSSYSKLNIKAIVNDNKIIIPCSIENTSKITKSIYYKIDNHKYKNTNLEYSTIYNDGQQNLQDIILDAKNHNKNNQIIDITFYYDKELLIKKIMKGIWK